jgi:acyl transferase domain-containing protein
VSNETSNDLPGAIAIIGLAGRFPQAPNLEAFWQNLRDGREAVTFFSEEELLAAGVKPELIRDPNYVPARAMLEGAEQFDAAFFGYSAREAEIIDPQQRLFLECAWEALETAGYDSERYDGPIGVYGGLSTNSYLTNNLMANPEVQASMGDYQIMLGSDKDFLTTRVSYKLNLKGPSLNVQTACSTSLVAVQMACQSLLNYQCDLALAGGVSVNSPRKAGYLYQNGLILSPDGHCRAFDHRAQGIVLGEGVGLVVLKRYEEALKDGDTIHAIIRGSAINNDGASKVGYTAPSVDGQAEVILMAQSMAGVEPDSITYIEAHGTGTELGDPIEVSALTQAFRTGTQAKGFCAISSVKTHMGHLDAAAGIAGLIRTVLALKNKTLPPNLHFEKPNPHIDFANSPFYVNASSKAWTTDRLPRRAGVSSFGIGGTNAHVIVEEAAPPPPGQSRRPEQLLLLSARSEQALNTAGLNLAAWLRQNPQASLADVAYTLQVGRKAFKHRRILVSSSIGETLSALEGPERKPGMEAQQDSQDTPVMFLFPGQGAQYVNMGLDLYRCEPFFREQVDQCIEILKPHLGLDLHEVLYPQPGSEKSAEELIEQTWITQPALFTIEYSLAKLWMAWGVHPQALVGHSIGEYVAACLAGVFSLEDALALVAARGKMIQARPSGSMLSVSLAEAEIRPLLGDQLSLAAINAPQLCVVSGPHEAVEALQNALTAREVACRRLHTSHAFHSAMMEPILAPFTELVSQVSRHAPNIPYLSNLTGGWITPEQATSPAYWAAHLRSTVRFAKMWQPSPTRPRSCWKSVRDNR